MEDLVGLFGKGRVSFLIQFLFFFLLFLLSLRHQVRRIIFILLNIPSLEQKLLLYSEIIIFEFVCRVFEIDHDGCGVNWDNGIDDNVLVFDSLVCKTIF